MDYHQSAADDVRRLEGGSDTAAISFWEWKMSCPKNFRAFCLVCNFRTNSDRLDFGDFTIERIRPGVQAVKWRERLGCRRVPEFVLSKEFPSYMADENDPSGLGPIMTWIMDLLLTFRLFKVGDLYFNDVHIEDTDCGQASNSTYTMDYSSSTKYELEEQCLGKFVAFRDGITPKIRGRSSYISYCVSSFMAGANRSFFFRKEALHRIVDYVIALESLFLSDNVRWFLRRTLATRVSCFLDEAESARIVKLMYDKRSDIVHGNNVDLDESAEAKLVRKVKGSMVRFESLMRTLLIKLLDHELNTKEQVVQFVKGLYDLPSDVVRIMEKAQLQAQECMSPKTGNAEHL